MSALLEITRGDDEIVNIVVRDPNGVGADPSDPATWPLQDLTDCELWFYVKVSNVDLDVAAILAKGPADIVIDPDQVTNKGEATLALVPADTASIDRSYLDHTLKYEVQLKSDAGKISTVATGSIVIKSDLVRATS